MIKIMDSTQLLMFNSVPKKTESIKKDSHFSKAKRAYRSQPYDRSSPSTSRSSTGTPPSSPDQNNGENDPGNLCSGVNKEQKKQRREEANKRERTRMHTVNSAFDHLRQLVPTYPSNRKLSKIETLRLACSYIQDLTKLVNDNNIQAIHGEDVNLLYRTDHMESAGSYGNNATPHYSTTSSNGGSNVPAAASTIPGYMTTHLPPPVTAPSVCTPSSKSDFTITPPEFTTTSQPAHQQQHHQPHVATAGYYHQHPPTASTLPPGSTVNPGYVNSDPESQSESDIPSPNTAACHYSNMFITPSAPPPPSGIAVRPPPAISRVSSDSIIAMQMANASIGSSSPTYCGSPSAGAPCSPLTRAQHSSSSISHSQITSTLQCNPTPPAGLSSIQPSFSNLHTSMFPQCYSQ